MCQHRQPALVGLVRGLLWCAGRPLAANQRRVARLLLVDPVLRSSLPEVCLPLCVSFLSLSPVSLCLLLLCASTLLELILPRCF